MWYLLPLREQSDYLDIYIYRLSEYAKQQLLKYKGTIEGMRFAKNTKIGYEQSLMQSRTRTEKIKFKVERMPLK
jgi:hypothetical protein